MSRAGSLLFRSRLAEGLALFSYFLLFAPLLTIVVFSFLAPLQVEGVRVYEFTWRWYAKLFENAAIASALYTSFQISLSVSIGASLLGGMAALGLERGKIPFAAWLSGLISIPLVVPELVLGIAALIWFSILRLSLGSFSVVLSHITFTVSYVIVTVRARLRDVDPSLEEAAQDLGATPLRAFFRVTLPLMMPGVWAGGMMAFALSFDDFLISFFTAGADSDTLPIKLYSLIRFGLNREMYALSSLLIVATILGLYSQMWVFNRRRPTRLNGSHS